MVEIVAGVILIHQVDIAIAILLLLLLFLGMLDVFNQLAALSGCCFDDHFTQLYLLLFNI